jgi:beta-lactamase superfamily II metal-dependent hydrolase
MAWELEIHIIDVGQGESSLIIARNPTIPQTRTMLIDAGLPGCAETVHNYITALGLGGVDHILVSHYDGDHSGGIITLLMADNLYRLCEIIAEAAGNAANDAQIDHRDELHQVAAAASAAAAAALGGYDDGAANNRSNVAINAGRGMWNSVFDPNSRYAEVARDSILCGEGEANTAPALNASLIPSTQKRRKTCQSAGIAAGTTTANAGARKAAALTAVFNELRSTANLPGSRFRTNGIYHNAHIIDIGDTYHLTCNYNHTIIGRFLTNNGDAIQVPGINRQRTSNPILGSEVLWNTGPGAAAAPPNSPAIFVVSRRKYIWNAPGHSVPIASGQPDNDDSIGLILRFNNFFYYTGGDLPSQGEELIANAISNQGLPNPAGGFFPRPHCIACFKCGHHGSVHSTSQQFIDTIHPRAAFISCGKNQFGNENHPAQAVIDRIHNNGNIQCFYLTNCKYETIHVPASGGNDQLTVPGNKSRVAGDNHDDNHAAGRQRGNICVYLNEEESNANPEAGRRFHVRYYDDDGGVQHIRVEDILF